MKQLDKDTQVERSKVYYDKTRKRPTYIFLAVLIAIGLAMGLYDVIVTKVWWKGIVYTVSLTAISSALFFLLRLVIRDIALYYPEKILFCDRLKPTTALLFSSDTTFSEEQKAAIRKKIKSRKGIDLQTFKNKTHKNKKYVKRVDETVSWLLDVTRFDGILFDYNCIYGFYRNLTAAFLMDGIVLFGLFAINKWLVDLPLENSFFWGGIACVILSVITTLLAYSNGRRYAKRMYNVFLNLEDEKSNY